MSSTATESPDIRARRSRERIMRALAELAAEEGVADFSVQEVADRAGVSHRTVYRHYESREGLLDGLARWLDDQLVDESRPGMPREAAQLPDAAEDFFTAFDELSDLVEALVVVSLGTRSRVARREERTNEFHALLRRDVTAHLPAADAELVTALVRTLGSSNLWFLLRHEHGLDGARSGRVVSWALRTLLDDLRAGGGPAHTRGHTPDRRRDEETGR